MKNYFTIQKINSSKNQTKNDFFNLMKDGYEKPKNDSIKLETIVKEVNELYSYPDYDLVRKEAREFINNESDPFTTTKLSKEMKINLFQKQVLKDKSFNENASIPK